MSNYLIGDIHGCYKELKVLLEKVQFNPAVDTLWLTGDLVSRGPDCLKVLRLIRSLGKSVRMVLGNHDLNLLAMYAGVINCHEQKEESIMSLIHARDADELITWLRHQPLLQIDEEKKMIMVHAGITPQWDLMTARRCAREVERVLRSDNYPLLLKKMYGDIPNNWNVELNIFSRLRFSINVFTRIRYCFQDGQLDMKYKNTPDKVPIYLKPWFRLLQKVPKCYSIFFGHWASLMGKDTPNHIYGLDTGCCWGGELTLFKWEDKTFIRIPSFKNGHK